MSAADDDLRAVLARLARWYALHLPADRYRFNPPASDADLDALATLIGCDLPQSYRQLYRWHDGDADDRHGHVFGLPLLPLRDVRAQWQAWADVLHDFDGDRYRIHGGGWPAGAVDHAYANPGWIPLTHDGSGNHIGIDLDPGPAGHRGQIILFGRDEDMKAVLADSLGAFLAWISGLLEGGNYRLGPGDDVGSCEFRLKAPAVDHFHDGARHLLGAPGPYV